MKKNKLLCMGVLVFTIFSINVNATTSDSPVGTDLSLNKCTSAYQDKIISTNTSAYFSHCMKVSCKNYKYNIEYYSDNKVNCLNGNSNPYVKVTKNGCGDYEKKVCGTNEIKYCSRILYYDCGKKADGSSFKTTTKTTTTKYTPKPSTTTTTTTSIQAKDSRLSSLSLSYGNINFNSDTYSYDLNVDSTINTIDVNAVPVDPNSKVEVSGNANIVDGSVIVVLVTASDGNKSSYRITIQKEAVILSDNARLKTLEVDGYSLPFKPRTTSYQISFGGETNSLNLNYTTEDEKSTVLVEGNENLSQGGQIMITVTAEDGTKEYYYIDVLVKKKSNFLAIFFIVIVIIALGAGGFYVYKKFFSGKSGDKYEYE